MNISPESHSCDCQKIAEKVYGSMLKNRVVNVLRKGPESLSYWMRTVNMVVSPKQSKTLPLASFCSPFREPAGTITPFFLQLIITKFCLIQPLNAKETRTSISHKTFLHLLFLDGWVCLSLVFFSLCFRFFHFFHYFWGLLPPLFSFCSPGRKVIWIPRGRVLRFKF